MEKYHESLKYVDEILAKTKIGAGSIKAIKIKIVFWIAEIRNQREQIKMLNKGSGSLKEERKILLERLYQRNEGNEPNEEMMDIRKALA